MRDRMGEVEITVASAQAASKYVYSAVESVGRNNEVNSRS